MQRNTRHYVRDNNYDPEYFRRSLDDFEEAIDALEEAEVLYSSNHAIKAGTQQFYDENWEAIEEIDHCTTPESFDKDDPRVAWRDAVNLLKLLARVFDMSVEESEYSVYAA